MNQSIVDVDLCVIGAGSGGLTVAAGAAQMGARVALVEKGKMGGDCLNTGCVPSKSLLASANIAQQIREGDRFGLQTGSLQVDWNRAHRHVHDVIASIAPNDSVERFEGLGVRVIRAAGYFQDERTLVAGEQLIRAKYFVLATGSSPAIPPFSGLDRVDYFTNENIFDNRESIEHLIVLGGGPIAMEMAQAHRRLGARVTVMKKKRLLVRDDPELSRIVVERMEQEGVDFIEGGRDVVVEGSENGGVTVQYRTEEDSGSVSGSHLLVATGRRANVHGLNLEAAGVTYNEQGVEVDARLRTSNRRIFAVGDVAGPYQFTHMAAYQAGIVIRNILFKLPAKVDYSAVPWVTYTDPELAQVGVREADAEKSGIKYRVLSWPFSENDRAQTERRIEGMVKVITAPDGKVLGVSMVGLHAGELIQPWILAVSQGMKIGALASMIAPYPTLAEINKRVAGSFYTERLFSPGTRRLVRFLMRF